MKQIPIKMFKINCFHSFEGLISFLQKKGIIIPINAIGPKNAVVIPVKMEVESNIYIFILFKFTPKDFA